MADLSHDWLDSTTVLLWLKVPYSSDKAVLAQLCSDAAADWIEDQRPDLVDETVPEAPVFMPTDRIRMAGILATARLFARVDSPNGVVAFDELGAGSILSKDPDVARMLGRSKTVAVG